MTSMDTTLQSSSLQPNGGNLQNGQSNLQPQSSNAQSTGSLQQDALGPQAYRNFDGLTVQGTARQDQQSVTAGKGTAEIFIVLLAVLVVAAFYVFRRFLQTRQSIPEKVSATDINSIIEKPELDEQENAETATVKPKKTTKSKKVAKQSVKPKKKKPSAKRKKR